MNVNQIKTFNNTMDSFIDKILPELEEIYKDIHRNPELSMQEFRTAKIAADYLTKYNYEVSSDWVSIIALVIFFGFNPLTPSYRWNLPVYSDDKTKTGL